MQCCAAVGGAAGTTRTLPDCAGPSGSAGDCVLGGAAEGGGGDGASLPLSAVTAAGAVGLPLTMTRGVTLTIVGGLELPSCCQSLPNCQPVLSSWQLVLSSCQLCLSS